MFFILQLRIYSLLDQTDFWTAGSTRVIIQIAGWIGKKIYVERDKCFALSVLYFEVLASCFYCTNLGVCFDLTVCIMF